MSTVDPRPSHSFARRKPPHRIIIAHGENVRSFTIRPWLVARCGRRGPHFGTLYLSATGYLVFRDDLLAASIARQARMQHAYEDRIASLRSDIDRLTSRQLLNQEAVEAEMDRLAGRQAALDARQDSIAGLSQAARRAGIAEVDLPASRRCGDNQRQVDDQASDSETRDPLKTSSIAPVLAGAMPLAFASLRDEPRQRNRLKRRKLQLGAVDASLDALARDQVAYVDAIAAKVSHRTDRIASVLKRLGQRVPASHSPTDSGVGGPLVEIDENADPETFRSSVDLITGEIERFGAVRRLANQLPLSRPINGAPITSGYGARMDPFLGRPAMHTGVDFRARVRVPGARHRRRHCHHRRVHRRLRQHGRGRPRQRHHHALRPSERDRRHRRSGRGEERALSAGPAAPAARPARTFTTRCASTAAAIDPMALHQGRQRDRPAAVVPSSPSPSSPPTRCASDASMNGRRSPFSTRCGSVLSTPVRRSFTSWYGCST